MMYMINTKPDRQLRECLHKGAMDESNTCSGEHGRPLSAIPCMLLPLAHYPDTTPSVLPQISTLEYRCTRLAMRIGWMRIARWLNTTDCKGHFGVWGGPGEGKRGVERHHIGSVAAFQSPVAVLGLLLTHHCVKMTIW